MNSDIIFNRFQGFIEPLVPGGLETKLHSHTTVLLHKYISTDYTLPQHFTHETRTWNLTKEVPYGRRRILYSPKEDGTRTQPDVFVSCQHLVSTVFLSFQHALAR